MSEKVDISIITPSYNMVNYLKLCAASIADQEGCIVEHIVIDGGSTDGTVEWLQCQTQIKWISEKDQGMYDAINKGFKLSKGVIIGLLNCDEQYLPGTIKFVHKYFIDHTDIDIIFGSTLLIKPEGSLISYRKAYTPNWVFMITSHLYLLTCAMFFRHNILKDGNYLNPLYKNIGDYEFVIRLLKKGYRAKHINKYFSAFTMTGDNLSTQGSADKEKIFYENTKPFWVKTLKYPINAIRLMDKFICGSYFQQMPIEYSIFLQKDKRERFSIKKASFFWPK